MRPERRRARPSPPSFNDGPTVPCLETGTVEYNLWRIANSSGAEYFYAPSADELGDIFARIGAMFRGERAQPAQTTTAQR